MLGPDRLEDLAERFALDHNGHVLLIDTACDFRGYLSVAIVSETLALKTAQRRTIAEWRQILRTGNDERDEVLQAALDRREHELMRRQETMK